MSFALINPSRSRPGKRRTKTQDGGAGEAGRGRLGPVMKEWKKSRRRRRASAAKQKLFARKSFVLRTDMARFFFLLPIFPDSFLAYMSAAPEKKNLFSS
jgi:hypothetical protein